MQDFSALSIVLPISLAETHWVEFFDPIEPLIQRGHAPEIIFVAEEEPDSGLPMGVEWVPSPGTTRAEAMNVGAKAASGRDLLFFHADSVLTVLNLSILQRARVENPSAIHFFKRRFLDDGPWLMPLNEILHRVAIDWMGGPTTHDGITVARKTFLEMGGFKEDLKRGEGIEFSERAKAQGIKLQQLSDTIYTSARRYKKYGWGYASFEDLWARITV